MERARRSFVEWILGGGLFASLSSFVYPAIRFLKPPEVPEAVVNETSAGKVADLKPNSGKIVKFGAKPVLLMRLGESEWRAYSAVCTHLNCTVQFDEAKRAIWCACHNGLYDVSGQVVGGPPPRALEPYTVHVRAGEIIISRQA